MEKRADGERNHRRCNRSSPVLDRPREPPSVRCFCRPLVGPIYRPGWHRMLLLPADFGATITDKVGQEIELMNGLGEKWPVVLSLYDGVVALKRGWKYFIDRHELKECDLLVFKNNGSHFKVEIYNRTFSEKTLAYGPPSVVRFFKPLISDNWDDWLVLPKDVSASLVDKVGQETKLKNALGQNWTVRFSSYNGKMAFKLGWEKFVRHHNLKKGDILVFRGFNDGSLFEVQVFDGNTFCEKASHLSLIRTQHEGQHGSTVPVYSNVGGNIDQDSISNEVSGPDQDSISNEVSGSPPDQESISNEVLGSPPAQDSISNEVLGSPPSGRLVREYSYANRNIASSSVPPSANFVTPPPHGSHEREHNYKKRKLDKRVASNNTRSPQQETNNETESPADPVTDQETVTCVAVTSGQILVLPVELPVVQGLKKKGRSNIIQLMDEGSRLWPATFCTGTKILSAQWGAFAAKYGVQAGDRYSFTAAKPLTYKIQILRSA